jgi:hypothetical protein
VAQDGTYLKLSLPERERVLAKCPR